MTQHDENWDEKLATGIVKIVVAVFIACCAALIFAVVTGGKELWSLYRDHEGDPETQRRLGYVAVAGAVLLALCFLLLFTMPAATSVAIGLGICTITGSGIAVVVIDHTAAVGRGDPGSIDGYLSSGRRGRR